jgi:membrane-associated phospholipid phosphatase
VANSIPISAAKATSVLLHPIFIPLYFGWYAYPLSGVWLRYHVLVAVFLAVIPGILSGLWLLIRKEENFFLVEKANRIVPLGAVIIGIAFLAVGSGAWLPGYIHPGFLLVNVFLLTFFALLVTLYWKISLHGIGWGAASGGALAVWLLPGGLTTEIGLDGLPSLTLLLLCLGASVMVFLARLVLKAHHPSQLIAGWACGFGIMAALTLVELMPM